MKGDKQLALDGVKTQKQDQPQFQPQEVKA
jgi:hypothetical protein